MSVTQSPINRNSRRVKKYPFKNCTQNAGTQKN